MKSWPSWTAGLSLLILWQISVQKGWIASYLLPAPSDVFLALKENPSDFWSAFLSTLRSTAFGFGLSAILGYFCALVFVSFPILKRAFLPFAVFFQTVPVVAVAPLLVIWFGFGEPTARASAFIVSFFPVLANSLLGLSQVDPHLMELFQAYRAGRFKTLWSLQMPSSLAHFMGGLKISAGLAVIGSIVGEFVAGGGLGGMIDAARTQQRVDIVFAAILISTLLGILFLKLVQILSSLLLRIRPFFLRDLV